MENGTGICSDEASSGAWGYLLVFSNLAMVPAVILAWRRKLYYDAVVLALGGLGSAVYHGIYADIFLTTSPFGPSLNALDHSWGYWMTAFPLTYVGALPTEGRRILEIILLWLILTVSMVGFDSKIWIPGMGKDLTLAFMVILLSFIVVISYRVHIDGCQPRLLVKDIAFRYIPLVLITIGIGVSSKVMGDIWGCYTGLHSLWHFGIMMSLFSLYLLRNPEHEAYAASAFLPDNEIELSGVLEDPLTEETQVVN
eukprot:TRINITY_DN1296_c0_g1_i4.p1 TRINITY_DN1296_c0_g1~~TRINITY_DN1296_c0_g1_i4.p1  ORF type:complete len:254 (-),score=33.11 TRINITY_DN1296_c0_g1_i4:233-994(-)